MLLVYISVLDSESRTSMALSVSSVLYSCTAHHTPTPRQSLLPPRPLSCLLPSPNVAPFAAFGLLASTALAAPFASAAETHAASSLLDQVLALTALEPKNALSIPTWTIHVASVVEWVVAMALVWKYGDMPGNAAWKGLSWGMVPLLGGALCACTWHFFYNAESLEVLVALQAALTMIGNFTMWLAAFRIYRSTQDSSSTS